MTRTGTPTEEQFDVIIDLAKQQAELLLRMVGLVDPVWLGTQARRVVAQALAEEPDVTTHTAAYIDIEVYTEADRDLFDQVWHELINELVNKLNDDTAEDTNA